MTGKELIIYILENDLEDQEFFTDGKIPGLLTVEEVAAQLNTGKESVRVLFNRELLQGLCLGSELYIFPESVSALTIARLSMR